jgi:peptidoglycan/LPS O-acetylase OafA/YrhL
MRAASSPHWQGLDGLRALAVVAVVVYHFSPNSLSGGFLGVDVFFVVSGYLITRLLTTEFLGQGFLRIGRFYERRVRRLLPALLLLLVAVGAGALIWRDQLATVRGGVLSNAVFAGNWWLVFDHQSYFVAAGRPSMLQHLWSLGVEEQFYLVWPLLLAGVLAAGRRSATALGSAERAAVMRRAVIRLTVIAIVGAAASTALTWWLADARNVPYGSDGSTLYFGTDTHCMGLLLGAALGAWTALSGPISPRRVSVERCIEACGITALAGLVVLSYRLASYSTSLYRGDFLLISALVVAVIAVATRPGSPLGRALDLPLLRWIGVRSYGIYLWHWPVTVVTRPSIDTTMPTWLDQVVRVAVTVGLAAASYRFVERPVRSYGLRAALHALVGGVQREWRRVPPLPSVAGAVSFAAIAAVAVAVVIIGPAAPRPSAAVAASLGGRDIHLVPDPTHRPSHTPGVVSLPKISAFGDSVLLGAQHELANTFGGRIDAVESRQPDPVLADIRTAERLGSLHPLVVIHIGSNGLINPDDLRRTMEGLSPVRLVVVFNDHLDSTDRQWQKPNNATIASIVPQFANARVVDWDRVAGEHHDWLYGDDLHLRPQGAAAYTALIASTYRNFVAGR